MLFRSTRSPPPVQVCRHSRCQTLEPPPRAIRRVSSSCRRDRWRTTVAGRCRHRRRRLRPRSARLPPARAVSKTRRRSRRRRRLRAKGGAAELFCRPSSRLRSLRPAHHRRGRYRPQRKFPARALCSIKCPKGECGLFCCFFEVDDGNR